MKQRVYFLFGLLYKQRELMERDIIFLQEIFDSLWVLFNVYMNSSAKVLGNVFGIVYLFIF